MTSMTTTSGRSWRTSETAISPSVASPASARLGSCRRTNATNQLLSTSSSTMRTLGVMPTPPFRIKIVGFAKGARAMPWIKWLELRAFTSPGLTLPGRDDRVESSPAAEAPRLSEVDDQMAPHLVTVAAVGHQATGLRQDCQSENVPQAKHHQA